MVEQVIAIVFQMVGMPQPGLSFLRNVMQVWSPIKTSLIVSHVNEDITIQSKAACAQSALSLPILVKIEQLASPMTQS